MRAFIVVNKINDVFFQDCDTEFTDHINKQAVEQGLLEVNGMPICLLTCKIYRYHYFLLKGIHFIGIKHELKRSIV